MQAQGPADSCVRGQTVRLVSQLQLDPAHPQPVEVKAQVPGLSATVAFFFPQGPCRAGPRSQASLHALVQTV